jgi:hypothetical protein
MRPSELLASSVWSCWRLVYGNPSSARGLGVLIQGAGGESAGTRVPSLPLAPLRDSTVRDVRQAGLDRFEPPDLRRNK